MNELLAIIQSDINRYYQIEGDSGSSPGVEKLKLILGNPSLHAVILYRFLRCIRKKVKNSILRKIITVLTLPLTFWYQTIQGIILDSEALIGPGLYIGHPGGIRIGPVKMGKNCNVAHNVTIGIGGRGEERGLPEFGDQVWIGAMSVIFGRIIVGDGTTILPGTIISKNLPPKVTVAGNPGRIILRDSDNSEIIFGTHIQPQDLKPEDTNE